LGGKLFGDFRCSRSVFPLDSDDSDHNVSNYLDAVSDDIERDECPIWLVVCGRLWQMALILTLATSDFGS
jgi:hypothetical protein